MMSGVAREKRFPERAWRGATATDIAELRAWMLARHSRRHSDELEHWIGAIAEWRPPPTLSHHKLRWFRSVLLRYGPPGRKWEQSDTPDRAYHRLVRAIRSARMHRQNEKKRSPAQPRTSDSHPGSETDSGVARASSSRRTSSRSRVRSSSSSHSSTNGNVAPAPAPDLQPAQRHKEPTPPHW
jgi:hypothetical protein